MFRRLIAYNLLMIVLLCTFQFGITSHYCCGKLIGSKFILGDGKVSCGMKPDALLKCNHTTNIDRGCCRDFQAKFHFHEDFNSSAFNLKQPACLGFMVPATFEKTAGAPHGLYIPPYVAIEPPPDLSVAREAMAVLQVFRI